MAKSKIIKDLANGTTDTLTALKRTKVLLSKIDDIDIANWVNYEIIGYPYNVDIPNYRKTMGTLMGSYFKGSIAAHIMYNNVPIPLGNMPKDIRSNLLEIKFVEGVDTLKNYLKQVKPKTHLL